MKRILVLGACGFLGKQVLTECRIRGLTVTGACRCLGHDLRDWKILSKLIKRSKADSIINCACHSGSMQYVDEKPATVLHDNLRLCEALYRSISSAESSPLLVNPIANCVYPGHIGVLREEEVEAGPVHESVIGYASTRRLLLALCISYSREFGLRSRNWLMPNAYGPGDHLEPHRTHALNGIILRMTAAKLCSANTFTVAGSGSPRREWIYIEDAAQLIVDSTSIELSESWSCLNMAQRDSRTIKELVKLVAESIGFEGRVMFDLKARDGAPKREMDDEKFRKKFPNYIFTPMNRGILKTIAYYQKSLQKMSINELQALAGPL